MANTIQARIYFECDEYSEKQKKYPKPAPDNVSEARLRSGMAALQELGFAIVGQERRAVIVEGTREQFLERFGVEPQERQIGIQPVRIDQYEEDGRPKQTYPNGDPYEVSVLDTKDHLPPQVPSTLADIVDAKMFSFVRQH